jgi:hypothetical protein
MTPALTTPTGRKASRQHRRARQSARPVTPRRVSGPVGGRAATAATATGARAATAPRTALPRRSIRRRRAVAVGLSLGAFIRSLPDHRLLDRLIRGRWWIPVLGVMLAGVVAMQVEVLKLGASMGRSLERNSVLSSRNAALRQSVASLGDDQRIEQLAVSMGMVMPPPQAVGFLAAGADGNPGRALANIHEPSSSSFLSLTPTNGEIVTADTLAAANAPAGTTGSTSTIGSTPTSTSSTSSATTLGSTSGAAVTPTAAAPTIPSSAASTSAATPTPVTPAPTSSSTTSSTQPTSQQPTSQQPTASSTGAVGVGPPSTTTGG